MEPVIIFSGSCNKPVWSAVTLLKQKFMFRKIIALSFFASTLWTLVAFSQGSEIKKLSPFTSVEIKSTGKIKLTQDTVHSIRVEPADKSDDVHANVTDKTLSVDAPSGTVVYVSMKEIENLSIGGWGSITSESPIKSESLHLSINGTGKMELKDVDVKKLSADIKGIGKITVSGEAETTDMNIPGSGKIDATGLKTATCNANISGVGKCIVDVTDNLDVSISGSGSVNYVNPPKNISKSISGIGRVREADASASDTTSLRFGNKKITISDEDDEDKDKDKEKEHEKDWEQKWDKWGSEWQDKFPFGEKKEKKEYAGNKPSWPGIELGINGYTDADNSTTLPEGLKYMGLNYGKSISLSLNFFAVKKKFFDRHLFLYTGLGLAWNNYRFSNNITLNPNSSSVLANYDSISYSKNKLTASYLVAPAMVEIFFGNRRYNSFHISGGMMLGYKLGSHTKQKYESDGKTVKTKVYDDFNLNPFRASVRVSAGYGRVSIFAEQALTTMFQKNKGPVLYPFTVGIGVSSF